MKILFVLALTLGSQLLQADTTDDRIRSLVRNINDNSRSSYRLTIDEKIQVLKALKNADSILARVAELDQRPWPIPGQWPRPLPQRVCQQEDTTIMQSAFRKIKDIAYSGAGLNMSNDGAVTFAQQWINRFPCAAADQYVRDLSRIRNFAYSGAGLNMSIEEASIFAKNNVEILCAGYPLEKEFSNAYNFAYSSNGMNMSAESARKYAMDRVQLSAFSCRNY
jgi:hypothetical protein